MRRVAARQASIAASIAAACRSAVSRSAYRCSVPVSIRFGSPLRANQPGSSSARRHTSRRHTSIWSRAWGFTCLAPSGRPDGTADAAAEVPQVLYRHFDLATSWRHAPSPLAGRRPGRRGKSVTCGPRLRARARSGTAPASEGAGASILAGAGGAAVVLGVGAHTRVCGLRRGMLGVSLDTTLAAGSNSKPPSPTRGAPRGSRSRRHGRLNSGPPPADAAFASAQPRGHRPSRG